MSDDELKNIFGKNLSRILKEQDKTQADLYKYMKVSFATASNWCNGIKIPRLDKIQSICNWLNIEKSDLLEQHIKKEIDDSQKDRLFTYWKALNSLQQAQELIDSETESNYNMYGKKVQATLDRTIM